MKRTKRFLALVMVMLLALSLCGCGNTAKKLYGTWETSFDLSGIIEEEMGDEFEGFHEEFEITLLLEFNEDGTFKMYADEEKMSDTLDTYLESLSSFGADMIYEQLEETGMTREQVDEYIEEQFGMSVQEYMLDELHNSIEVGDLAVEVETEGVYEAKGKKLYMDEYEVAPNAYDIFSVEDDTLTIDAATEEIAEDAELIEGFSYPYVFKRVAE